MTLAEVASMIRREMKRQGVHWYPEQVIVQFECEPDFTLRSRLEAFLDETWFLDHDKVNRDVWVKSRLRTILEGGT